MAICVIANFIQFLCTLVLHYDTKIGDCVLRLVCWVFVITMLNIWLWTFLLGSLFRFDDNGRFCADEPHLESEGLVFKVYMIGYYIVNVPLVIFCYYRHVIRMDGTHR